jgi:hypothetical protein
MKCKIELFLILVLFLSCSFQDENIKGAWASEDSPAADYIILDDDKIWYFEAPDTNRYKIKDDMFYLFEKDYLIARYKILKLKKDSMVLQTEDGTIITKYKIKL